MATLKEVFGEEFANKFEKTLVDKTKIPKLRLEGNLRQEVIRVVKQMNPERPQLHYPFNDRTYHIILAKTGEEPIVKETKYSKMYFPVRWNGRNITLFADDQIIDTLEPNTHYVFVGIVKVKPREDGGSWYNMRCDAVITMDEIIKAPEFEEVDGGEDNSPSN